MSEAGTLTRPAALDRGVTCRAWHAVLAAVIGFSLVTQATPVIVMALVIIAIVKFLDGRLPTINR